MQKHRNMFTIIAQLETVKEAVFNYVVAIARPETVVRLGTHIAQA